MTQKEIIERMQNRIMEHQKENGFSTIFDFLNEDLQELAQPEVNKLALGDFMPSFCSGFEIKIFESETMQEGKGALFLNPKNMPRKNEA
jgi:hypothetical protein